MAAMGAQVVIADDSPTILQLIAVALTRGGIESATASDGAEAIEWIKEHRPQVVILDATMPNGGGHDVCQEIRADAGLEQLT